MGSSVPERRSDRAVSVCVPSVRAATVAGAIESVRAQTIENWELLVVMQGDDEELPAVVARFERDDARVRGIRIAERGVSRARNAGAAAASCSTIAFLDDDCEATPDWLERLCGALGDDPSVGIVAAALEAPPRSRWRVSKCPESIPDDFTLDPRTNGSDLPPGARFVTASCAIRRWAWDLVGPFDAELGPGSSFPSSEDLDLLVRAVAAGVPVRFLPGAVVRHSHGTRYGVRAVVGMSVAYATGQGALAAKIALAGGDGARWRSAMRREIIVEPWRAARPHRLPPRVPRLVAFERAYRRCRRDYTVGADGLLARRGS